MDSQKNMKAKPRRKGPSETHEHCHQWQQRYEGDCCSSKQQFALKDTDLGPLGIGINTATVNQGLLPWPRLESTKNLTPLWEQGQLCNIPSDLTWTPSTARTLFINWAFILGHRADLHYQTSLWQKSQLHEAQDRNQPIPAGKWVTSTQTGEVRSSAWLMTRTNRFWPAASLGVHMTGWGFGQTLTKNSIFQLWRPADTVGGGWFAWPDYYWFLSLTRKAADWQLSRWTDGEDEQGLREGCRSSAERVTKGPDWWETSNGGFSPHTQCHLTAALSQTPHPGCSIWNVSFTCMIILERRPESGQFPTAGWSAFFLTFYMTWPPLSPTHFYQHKADCSTCEWPHSRFPITNLLRGVT